MSYSLSFSKAILVVIFISDKIRQGQYEYLSTATIAKLLNIPKPTLVKIMQSLSADGIIETKEGKLGGIRLARDPADITLLDILNCIEKGKPLFQTSFNLVAQGKRPDKAQTTLMDVFQSAESNMKNTLAQKTIDDILREMSE
ncbi:MAG: Rrf2 family transcriptional regulator [Bacteroidetes bacterium]|nr:MAG: Rrf2 family transcriptional regulator [Bacteroidota bacterium]